MSKRCCLCEEGGGPAQHKQSIIDFRPQSTAHMLDLYFLERGLNAEQLPGYGLIKGFER